MKKKIIEQSVLFISVLKWFTISSFIGVVVGGVTTLFLYMLMWSTKAMGNWSLYFLLVPVGFFVSSMLTTCFCPEAEGHGTEQVIEAVHQRAGKINPMVVPIKLLATLVTLTTGGAAGKEGPCAQIGAGVSSLFADLFRVNDLERKKLVICGISAGFAAVFGTPIAGAIFGVEVLAIGQLQYAVLFPSFVAGIMAYQTSSAFGITYFHHLLHFSHNFNELFFSEVSLIGIACGLCSFLFVEMMTFFHHFSEKIKIWKPYRGLIGGLLVLTTVLVSSRYLGLGLTTIEQSLNGTYVSPWYDFLLKMFATAATLGFGGSGGIVTPIFFIGSTFGSFLATIMGLDHSVLAALGLVGLLSGCANTPISASIMAMELFGTDIGPYAAVVCVISFVLTGHRSVYPSQILSMQKSDSLSIELGGVIEDVEAEYHPKHSHT